MAENMAGKSCVRSLACPHIDTNDIVSEQAAAQPRVYQHYSITVDKHWLCL